MTTTIQQMDGAKEVLWQADARSKINAFCSGNNTTSSIVKAPKDLVWIDVNKVHFKDPVIWTFQSHESGGVIAAEKLKASKINM